MVPAPAHHRRTAAAAGAISLVLTLAGVAGCSGDGSADAGTGGGSAAGGGGGQMSKTRYVAGHGTVTTVPADERVEAPELSGKDLEGKPLDLSDYRGQTVVLNVWGSWCPPCRKEAPDLARAARKLADRDVAFVGINTRDNDPTPAKAFVRTFDVPYPSLYDPQGEQLLGFRDILPPSAIPSTLVIDPQGRVAGRVLGAVTYQTIVGMVDDVTAQS